MAMAMQVFIVMDTADTTFVLAPAEELLLETLDPKKAAQVKQTHKHRHDMHCRKTQ